MLRRCIALITACAFALAGCGIKGPLKPAPGKPAPTVQAVPPPVSPDVLDATKGQ